MAASFYKWLIIPLFSVFYNENLQNISERSAANTDQQDAPLIYRDKLLHPFFVCVTEINHNTNDKTLEISCKIFADDFEKVLTQKYKSVVSITQPKDKAALDKWIDQYINEHLSLKADGKGVQYTYLGFEKEEDAVYCYLQVDNIASVKKIDAANTMLHDLNTNQVNIMHVTVAGNRKSTKLDYPESVATFSF